jgi:hypothetical protein
MTIKTPHSKKVEVPTWVPGFALEGGTFATKTNLCDWIGSVKMNQKTTKQTIELNKAFGVTGVVCSHGLPIRGKRQLNMRQGFPYCKGFEKNGMSRQFFLSSFHDTCTVSLGYKETKQEAGFYQL